MGMVCLKKKGTFYIKRESIRREWKTSLFNIEYFDDTDEIFCVYIDLLFCLLVR